MNIVAITTTGTSLITNTKRNLNITGDVERNDLKKYIKKCIKDNKITEISAEINASIKLNELYQKKYNKRIDEIHLIFSDTEEAKLEEKVLKDFFSEQGFAVQSSIITGLNYKESKFKLQGLRSLIEKISGIIKDYKRRNYKVIMNATGGFKAEIAYATVVSQLLHIESYYIYEKFRDIVPLPYLPLSLDYGYWGKAKYFFDKFYQGIEKEEGEKLLNNAINSFKGFNFLIEEIEIDDKIYYSLNPAGLMFFESLELEKEIYLSELNSKKVFRKNNETTLWHVTRNINVEKLDDIPDSDVKKILTRIIRFNFVHKLELVDYGGVGRGVKESSLEYISLEENKNIDVVRYKIKCKDGEQNIAIQVQKGFGKELIDMIGKKVYA